MGRSPLVYLSRREVAQPTLVAMIASRCRPPPRWLVSGDVADEVDVVGLLAMKLAVGSRTCEAAPVAEVEVDR